MLRKLTAGNEAWADDLAQQTFIRAYRSMKNYRGEGQLSTWLYRIAYNLFKTELTRTRSHESTDQLEVEETAAPATSSVGFQADLEAALGKLGEDERASVVLCLVNGCTHEEAADILKMPLGTVKTHVLRGKEKLKQTLIAWQKN